MIGTLSGSGPGAVNPLSSPLTPTAAGGTTAGREKSFTETLAGMIDGVNEAQQRGDQAIERLQSGGIEHLHEVMIAVEEADISLRMLVQMRNKAQTAYEEIMRMQI